MNKNLLKFIAILILSVVVSACGGKAAKKQTAEAGADITRPPQVKKDRTVAAPTNPDEAVSFDEWQKANKANEAEAE